MAKLGDCPLCPPGSGQTMQERAWQAWAEDGAGAVCALYRARLTDVSPEDVRRHFSRHRPLQGPAEKLPAREALEAVQGLPEKRRAILSLLFRSPGMSARQIADICFLGTNPNTALPAALRDLRLLQKGGFVLQVFLEQLPGPGPRPGGGHPGLFFPGANARELYRLERGVRARPGREWWSGVNSWDSWQEAWECWQRAEIRDLLIRQFPVLGQGWRGAKGIRLDWAGIHDRPDASFLFQDPLLGRTRFPADGILGFSLESGTVPVIIQHDRGSIELEKAVRRAASLAAVHRSGQLEKRFNIPGGGRALLLVISEDPERVREALSIAGRLTVAGDSPVLICDSRTAALGFDRACWQPLFRESGAISLRSGLEAMQSWPLLGPGETLRLRSRNPQKDEAPAISSGQ